MPGTGALLAAATAFAVWVGLLAFRGGFWRADQRLATSPAERPRWPDVVCVIPARNEAETIGGTVRGLLDQDYPGEVAVIVVDDNSDDGTAGAAGTAARLTVVAGRPLAAGWTGKLWAVRQGLEAADRLHGEAPYVLLTDADIRHDPKSLCRLVAKAEDDGLDLVSLMVLLRCQSFWERLLVPAFVFFFQMLYPFPWVNDPRRRTAAAAGGCMLVRRTALRRAGGVDAIHDRLIDDCALAARIKAGGPIWLGLTPAVRSARAYETLADIWRMVARTAYEQLGNRPAGLAVCVVGMALAYGAPPLAALGVLGGGPPAMVLGGATWLGLMAVAYRPTAQLYGLSARWVVLLPAAAALFTAMTVTSALDRWRGRGGAWKGRRYGAPEAADG